MYVYEFVESVTFTLHVAFLPLYVAVIFALPCFIPFTFPYESTVAIFVLLDLYDGFTVLPLYVAVIFSVFPFLIDILALFSVNSFSAFGVSLTLNNKPLKIDPPTSAPNSIPLNAIVNKSPIIEVDEFDELDELDVFCSH